MFYDEGGPAWTGEDEIRSLENQLKAIKDRASFIRANDGYETRVLWALHNTQISVGRACELLRQYIKNGVEIDLPK